MNVSGELNEENEEEQNKETYEEAEDDTAADNHVDTETYQIKETLEDEVQTKIDTFNEPHRTRCRGSTKIKHINKDSKWTATC